MAPTDRSAALTVPPPAPPSRAASRPAPQQPATKRERPPRPLRPPDAAAVSPPSSPRFSPPSPPRAESAAAAALAPPLAANRAPLVQGPPRFRRPPSPPEYPAQARDRGEEGTVALRLLVGADGATREIRLHRSSGNRLLDAAAIAAAGRWEVEPASLDGRRAEAWFEVPVRFRLDR
jgi:periplasmic protein TonB